MAPFFCVAHTPLIIFQELSMLHPIVLFQFNYQQITLGLA